MFRHLRGISLKTITFKDLHSTCLLHTVEITQLETAGWSSLTILEAIEWWESIAQKTASPLMDIFIVLYTQLHPNKFFSTSTFSPLWILLSWNLKSSTFTFYTVWMLRGAIPENVHFQCYNSEHMENKWNLELQETQVYLQKIEYSTWILSSISWARANHNFQISTTLSKLCGFLSRI